VFIVFSCFGLLSCAFFCVVWFCYYVSEVIGWEDLLSWYLSCQRVSPTETRLECYL